MSYLLLYVALALFVGIAGINRKLGFWGYFILSLIFSPLIGLVVVVGSDPRNPRGIANAPTEQQQNALAYACIQAKEDYARRISSLVSGRRITQEYADRNLLPLLCNLEKTLRFRDDGTVTSPLDMTLEALRELPERRTASDETGTDSASTLGQASQS